MAFTKAHAKIAADMLSDEARKILAGYRTRQGGTFSEEAVKEVTNLRFIEQTTNLLDGKKIWALTPNGKKVAEYC